MNVLLATGLLYSFEQADLQGKVIVLILLFGSALTWSVMLTKWQQLRRTQQSGAQLLAQFRRERDPLHLYINNFEIPDCPLYNIYRMGAEEVSSNFGTTDPRKSLRGLGTSRPASTPAAGGVQATLAIAETDVAAERAVVNLSTLHSTIGRAVDAEVLKLESHVSLLSTAVQGGPFLGLLGSAWGVMSVFGQMGVYGTVRLGAVAPGISAALLATVVGLFVAVPSLLAYNWLAGWIRRQTLVMENFADEFIAAVERNYLTN